MFKKVKFFLPSQYMYLVLKESHLRYGIWILHDVSRKHVHPLEVIQKKIYTRMNRDSILIIIIWNISYIHHMVKRKYGIYANSTVLAAVWFVPLWRSYVVCCLLICLALLTWVFCHSSQDKKSTSNVPLTIFLPNVINPYQINSSWVWL